MNPRTGLPPDLSGLSEWAPELAQTFVSLASDIALVLDDEGVIRVVAQGNGAPLSGASQDWVGRSWADTATGDTRGKIEQLLDEVNSTGVGRKREINHPSAKGGNVAVAYTAIRLGENGPLLAVGRDMGTIAAIQQRFLDAQQEMERGYWRVRQAEARYRLLFQVATDAVLLVNSDTLEILEANHAASRLFDMPVEQITGRPAAFGFERHSRHAVDELLATARESHQPAEIRARLAGKISTTSVAATPFRSDDAMRLLVRIRTMDMPGTVADLSTTLARLVDGASDGVVVTDPGGRILIANPAFLKLIRMNTEAAVKGRPLTDWLGLPDDQFARLIVQARRQGITQRVAARLLAADAHVSQIDLSAALLTEGDQECIGFTFQPVVRDAVDTDNTIADLHTTVAQLSGYMGSEPLPDLLRRAAALLERHFIRIAMERSDNDPEAAARLLGVGLERLDLPSADQGPLSGAQ